MFSRLFALFVVLLCLTVAVPALVACPVAVQGVAVASVPVTVQAFASPVSVQTFAVQAAQPVAVQSFAVQSVPVVTTQAVVQTQAFAVQAVPVVFSVQAVKQHCNNRGGILGALGRRNCR